MSAEHPENEKYVFASTTGVIFFGTPHGGSSLTKFALSLASVANTNPFKVANKGALRVLERNSEVLAVFQGSFKSWIEKRKREYGFDMQIHTFVEERPVKGLGRVSYTSMALWTDLHTDDGFCIACCRACFSSISGWLIHRVFHSSGSYGHDKI